MLSLSEIKIGTLIKIADKPYAVIRADHHKMGRGGAVLKTKLKNLFNGNIIEKTFQGNDKAEEIKTETNQATYLYKTETQAYFMNNENFEQFSLPIEQICDKLTFLKENMDVNILYFQGNPASLKLPVKISLKVTGSPPGVKGNSAGSVTKTVQLETGMQINAPMFINEGDIVIVNTDTGEYVSRG
ncbi:elongation factor P [Patescibacteria group bacterium]|nr:elongation factor P [Patescibacteria group bacterium]MBU1663257.1 elongation factor P [Patescibacteria group bacterium]MBU1934031.1 elongation factor P [Patescibacteria group bacterium]MBU2007971.1 elongation factor P [Patescibacteria group bacterium]MBU2264280.1 elongation factor P [Patescibacteria group bacterium]